MTRLRLFLIAIVCLFAVAPSVALAGPGKHHARGGFAATFPHAAKLCAKVQAGTPPAKLAASAAKITESCTTLKAGFTAAQTSFKEAVAPLKQQAKAAVVSARATCKTARAAGDRAACRAARKQARTTLRDLRKQAKVALQARHAAVQAARKTFWDSIKALKGGQSVTADTTVGPAATVALPADSAV